MYRDAPSDRLYIRLHLKMIGGHRFSGLAAYARMHEIGSGKRISPSEHASLAFFGLIDAGLQSRGVSRNAKTRLPGLDELLRSVGAGGSRARFLWDPEVDSRTESASFRL